MRRAVWPLGPWKAAALVALALSGVAAFGLAPGTRLDEVPTQLTVRVLDRPPIADAQAGRADFAYWREERVRRGDTIGELLARAGIDDAALRAVVRSDPAARRSTSSSPDRPCASRPIATGACSSCASRRRPTAR
jgi:hypothetical protein